MLLTDMQTTGFLELYEQTLDDVYRYASRLTGGDRVRADELVQDTYLRVLHRLRTGGPDLELGRSYVIVTCRSSFLDGLRAEERRRRREARAASLHPAPPIEQPERHAAIDALAQLNDIQRAVLVLRHVDDLPVAEVAALVDRSVRATESLLVRARQALRAAYREGVEP